MGSATVYMTLSAAAKEAVDSMTPMKEAWSDFILTCGDFSEVEATIGIEEARKFFFNEYKEARQKKRDNERKSHSY